MMLKNSLKRIASQSQSVDEEASFGLKHQSLLQDFLELQKEFVSKKKKLETTKQKRDILLAEVDFLRWRYRYLMDIQSDNLQLEQDSDPVPPQNSFMQNKNVGKLLRVKKLPKNDAINGKRVDKKISWQDHSAEMKV